MTRAVVGKRVGTVLLGVGLAWVAGCITIAAGLTAVAVIRDLTGYADWPRLEHWAMGGIGLFPLGMVIAAAGGGLLLWGGAHEGCAK